MNCHKTKPYKSRWHAEQMIDGTKVSENRWRKQSGSVLWIDSMNCIVQSY